MDCQSKPLHGSNVEKTIENDQIVKTHKILCVEMRLFLSSRQTAMYLGASDI